MPLYIMADWLYNYNVGAELDTDLDTYGCNYLQVAASDGTLTISEIPYSSDMQAQVGVSS